MKLRHAFAGLALAALALPGHAQQITLKIAHFLPAGASAQQRVLQPWCDDLHAQSGGRIVCQFYPAMQLGGTPAQLVDQVKNGIADVVWTSPGYSTGRFPRIEVFELPFMVSDSSTSAWAIWNFYQKYDQQEFSQYKALAFYLDGGAAIHTGSKPINGLADWAGLKLRTPTRLGTEALVALGGTPVGMPPSQLTESISKGVVDGAMGSWELLGQINLDEVTHFHIQPPVGQPFPTAVVLTVLMNKQKYESLPPDLKALIDKTTGLAMSEKFGRVFDDEADAARKKVLAGGGKIIDFTPEQMAAMRKATAPVEAHWIEQVDARGADGKALVAEARALLDEAAKAGKP